MIFLQKEYNVKYTLENNNGIKKESAGKLMKLSQAVLSLLMPVALLMNSPRIFARDHETRVLDYFQPPVEFLNYRQKSTNTYAKYMEMGGVPVYGVFFDVNSDSIADVVEITPLSFTGELPRLKGKPVVYGFNINQNQNFEVNERWFDEKRDGLNGNEVRVSLMSRDSV